MELKNKYYHICIPVRTALFLFILMSPNHLMKYWLILAILLLCGAIYRYLSYNDQQKGAFGQPVHWQNMRLFHIIIIVIFIISILSNHYNLAKLLPLIDIFASLIYMNSRYN